MRLNPKQIQIIRQEAQRAFGPDVALRLFGSRLDDASRGGDIDLWVDVPMTAEQAMQAEGRFYAALQRRLGEQRIDIVVHRQGIPLRPIDEVALREGVGL